MCGSESWRGGVARSPSHESVTTDLSLFSVSSAASDARVLRLLACKVGRIEKRNKLHCRKNFFLFFNGIFLFSFFLLSLIYIRNELYLHIYIVITSFGVVIVIFMCLQAGQGPDPSLRVASPNPEGKPIK